MKNRSPIAVFFLSLITFGVYALYWQISTKGEMNKLGANIPTAWLLVIPFVNIWWMWKYCEGVEKVTGNKLSTVIAFILLWILGIIGMAIIQNDFNQVGGQTETASAPAPTAQPVATEVTTLAPQAPAPSQDNTTPSSTPPTVQG